MSNESDFYKSILDDLYDSVYFVDKDRRITYWNRGAERITGFKGLQVVGKRCADTLMYESKTASRNRVTCGE
jgi:PAS domain S-box-containing protein